MLYVNFRFDGVSEAINTILDLQRLINSDNREFIDLEAAAKENPSLLPKLEKQREEMVATTLLRSDLQHQIMKVIAPRFDRVSDFLEWIKGEVEKSLQGDDSDTVQL